MRFILFFFITICHFLPLKINAQLPAVAEDIAPLLTGEIFPDQALNGFNGTTVTIGDLVKKKPTILIFYRGGWCPYCNHHLKEIGEVESDILQLGYQIVGISPDHLDELNITTEKNELNYTLLSDADGKLSQAIGIAFQAPERYDQRLHKVSGGLNPGYLPVPSVFVLGSTREILFEYINPNYKQRLSGGLLLAVLKALKEE